MLVLSVFFISFHELHAQIMTSNNKTTIYLIPGQGADRRLFSNLKFDATYVIKHIEFNTPQKNACLKGFAKTLATQIDTSGKYILIGVSLGGMICSEMCGFLNPEKIVLISSAKSRAELPLRIRFMKYFPLNKLIPKYLYKIGAQIAQPIVEPDRKHGKKVFKAMLKDKKPEFLKRTANIIVNWNKNNACEKIIHIHGDNDHTLPLKCVKADYVIKGGSHMMVYTKGNEISELLRKLL